MSGTVKKLTEAVAECPICGDQFEDVSKLPRRMPCCEQPICEVCLNTYIEGRTDVLCPLCRVDVVLPGGAKSLPKDMTVLRFLDALTPRRDAILMCIDCPGKNKTMVACGECGVYLCATCVKAHARNRSTRTPGTSKFADSTVEKSTKPQSANRRGTSRVDPLDTKLYNVERRMWQISGIEENISKSQKKATKQINKCFDDMMEELQHRRGILLSQVKTKADKERKSIKTAQESHKNLKKSLKSASKSGHSAASLLQETPEDVEAEGIGVTFTEVNMQQLLSTIRSAGQVRLVTFTPIQRPSFIPEDKLFNAVKFSPEDLPQVTQSDVQLFLGGKDVIGPHLEFDHKTATDDVQISSGMVSNMVPDPAPQDTGCRLQSRRRVLTQRPLFLRRGQIVVFTTRVVFTVKQLTEDDMTLYEVAVTASPVDAHNTQTTGLSVHVVTCSTHKQQLCLQVRYDDKLFTDVPLTRNQVGVSRDIYLCIVIDRDANKIHVVDVTDAKVVTTTEASLDQPLWVMMYVDRLSHAEMKSELISGRELTLPPKITHLLSTLISRCLTTCF